VNELEQVHLQITFYEQLKLKNEQMYWRYMLGVG